MPRFEGIRRGYVGRVDHSVVVVKDDKRVPEQVQFEFDHAMQALFPSPPETLAELRDALGGTNKAAALLPGKQNGHAAARTLQRYIAAEEHRHVSAHSIRRSDFEKREKIITQLQDAWRQRFSKTDVAQRDGVRVTGVGSLRIGGYNTEGRFITVVIPGKGWKTILRHWDKGDKKGAALAFQQWFGRTYGRAGGRPKGKRREDFSWAYLQELTFEPLG